MDVSGVDHEVADDRLTEHFAGADDTIKVGDNVTDGRMTQALNLLENIQWVQKRPQCLLVGRCSTQSNNPQVFEHHSEFSLLDFFVLVDSGGLGG